MGAFWPVVGVLGPRQSGKSTLFRDILEIPSQVTLDDEDVIADLEASSKNFLAKHPTPLVIDEAQKSAKLFDAIKMRVDRKKHPGSYYLTGSSQFSAKFGIRESLTGRIGLLRLYPFTLAEAHESPFDENRVRPFHTKTLRFRPEQAVAIMASGAFPVPLFSRNLANRDQYYRLWLETSVLRDVARAYGRNYDPDRCWSILKQIGKALRSGELPSFEHLTQDSRQARRYLDALELVFILKKIPCHEAGVGKDAWLPVDGGIAIEIMGTKDGEGPSLSLARIFLLNEISARCEYAGNPIRPTYYKTARGGPVDWIWNGVPIKISAIAESRQAYDERPLAGAMKKFGSKTGILCVPRDLLEIRREGISVVPWSYWS